MVIKKELTPLTQAFRPVILSIFTLAFLTGCESPFEPESETTFDRLPERIREVIEREIAGGKILEIEKEGLPGFYSYEISPRTTPVTFSSTRQWCRLVNCSEVSTSPMLASASSS